MNDAKRQKNREEVLALFAQLTDEKKQMFVQYLRELADSTREQ